MHIDTHNRLALRHIKDILASGAPLQLDESCRELIQRCRTYLDNRLDQGDEIIYGINTGFGYLVDRRIAEEDQRQLQVNLIRSHACGTGEEVPPEIVRIMLMLKIKSLSLGYSGVTVETVNRLVEMYNQGITPVVYTQGSLGASGDLAPLAHLVLPLLGEGEAWQNGRRLSGIEVLETLGWEPHTFHSKEGLALLNGTQFMSAYGVHLLLRAQALADLADHIAALSLDAFDGRIEPFDPVLHEIRPHAGQVTVAGNLLSLLEGSELAKRHKDHIQDPYSFRCVPQVHGASRDAIAYALHVFETEINSVTDNPNIFVEEDKVLSGGNFHGQPLAIALDFLAIAIAELGSISERRIFQLVSGSRGLPAFLVAEPGLNSGMMIPQYTAAGIVSQNKQLCTPASVDTIPSSNNQEDHVSMGANAATKCLRVLENTEQVLAIELINASQALHFREPLQTGTRLRSLLERFRQAVPIVKEDRFLQPDLKKALEFVRGWGCDEPGISKQKGWYNGQSNIILFMIIHRVRP